MTFDPTKPWWQDWEYRDARTGVRAEWMSHTKTFIYHATTDGSRAMCGAKGELEHRIPWTTVDPSDDCMTCKNCECLVTRKKKQQPSSG